MRTVGQESPPDLVKLRGVRVRTAGRETSLGYERGEGAPSALFLVPGGYQPSPSPPTPATTEVDQSITDAGFTTCLLKPSSLGSSPSASPTSCGRCSTGMLSGRPTTCSA